MSSKKIPGRPAASRDPGGIRGGADLSRAIRQVLEARCVSAATVAAHLAGRGSKPTFYRLLTGQIARPRLDTFVELCAGLGVSPTELLQLAGWWPFGSRSTDPVDVRLRALFGQIQRLPPDAKRLAVAQVESLGPSWTALAGAGAGATRRPGRPGRSGRASAAGGTRRAGAHPRRPR
jgi:hypothetical protein